MKPYEIINHITEDLLTEYFLEDYCLLWFPDHIRYNPDVKNEFVFLYDKHLIAGDKNSNFSKYFFHNNEWLLGSRLDYKLRKKSNNIVYQHSWEPIHIDMDKDFWKYIENLSSNSIVLHSEHNSEQIEYLNKKNIKTVHWFAHAYLCSEIYFKHYKKFKMVKNYKQRPINYPWISANRLLRDYRIEFLHKIDYTKGAYSLLEEDAMGKRLWGSVPAHSFDHHGNDSAEIEVSTLTPWNTSFLHIVNETVWQDRIHFTEKVFKPIVMHQPFVVLQAPGSLEYLRSYGFKTFGDFWDESYDTIEDPNARMQAIADIVNWIPTQDLYKMRNKMSGILEHNFRHFYEKIPDIVLDELRVAIQLASS